MLFWAEMGSLRMAYLILGSEIYTISLVGVVVSGLFNAVTDLFYVGF